MKLRALLPVAMLLWPTLVWAQADPRSVVLLDAGRTRGAGVVLSSDGLVITSTRAVGKHSGDVVATTHPDLGGVTLKALVLARDDWFTLLQLDGQGFVPARMGTTAPLRARDGLVTLNSQEADFQLVPAEVVTASPLVQKPAAMQDPLVIGVRYQSFNAGGPVFNRQGLLVGIVQGDVDRINASKALRVEDVRGFMARFKSKIPVRMMTLTGPPGMTAQTEYIARATLPLTFTSRPGDGLTFHLARRGKLCGLYRAPTHRLEPRQTVAMDMSGPLGSLELQSLPEGALVEVDGHPMGRAPLTLDCMGQGAHKVTVSKAGFEGRSDFMVVQAGQPTRARVKLRRLEGTLSVQSTPPGGQVWADGALLGHTPLNNAVVTAGSHVVSVMWPGGARVRRTVVVEDQQHVDAGTVNLPAPGAVLFIEHHNVTQVYVDGHDQQDLHGHVVLLPGPHVIQARDHLGNVLTETWDAPAGGVHLLRFNGGASRVIPLFHLAGSLSAAAGLALVLLGVALLVGIPGATHLGAWALGGLLDAVHRQLWIPTVTAGVLTALPLVAVGTVLMVPGVAAVPWELWARQGTVVPAGGDPGLVPYAPTAGWEVRPVADAAPRLSSGVADADGDTPLVEQREATP